MSEKPTREEIRRALADIEHLRNFGPSPIVAPDLFERVARAYLASLDAPAPTPSPIPGQSYTVPQSELCRASPGLVAPKDGTREPQYEDPTPEMLSGDRLFDAIWNAIRGWDISRHNDGLYSSPTGNDARHIYDAIKRVAPAPPVPQEGASNEMVSVALAAFDSGPKDGQRIEENMRLALEAALAAAEKGK